MFIKLALPLTLMWIRILNFLFDADPDPTFHPYTDPDPNPSFKKRLLLTYLLLAWHLQIDANPDPVPGPDFYLMRI
jgi:hypothetical protein